MRVIRKGPAEPKVEWVTTIICPYCESLLEYTNVDVFQKLDAVDGYGTDIRAPFPMITCGNCKRDFRAKIY